MNDEKASPRWGSALQFSVTVRRHFEGGLAGSLATLTFFLFGLLFPTELAAQQAPATPNDYWFKVSTAVIGIPAALVAILAIRRARLETGKLQIETGKLQIETQKLQIETQKLQIELNEKTAETKATANDASDRANIATAQAEKANKEAEEARRKLDRFIFLAMPKPTYDNLVKLAKSESFGGYRADEGFKAQLRFLRDAGYINFDGHVSELQDGDNLSIRAQVTKLGKEFIENRERLAPTEG